MVCNLGVIVFSAPGSGGMGEVYLAEDLHIHRQIAIKIVRTEASSYPNTNTAGESERLFRREVRAIASLDHPHILPLFDYGEETAHDILYTYMVMPLRSEGSLATWLRQRSTSSPLPLSPSEVLHFIRQSARALAYAHQHQIIHQDVKPSSFLIRANEEKPDLPDVMLADFGIAKFYTATSSMSQTSRGTPSYMAPEQWSGQPVAASDQYALAIMAYQLLTGNPPFQGRQEQVMYLHFNAQLQPPSKLNPRVPAAVDAVILRALAKKPEERFPSVSAFAQALQQVVQSAEKATMQNSPSSFLPTSPSTTGELRATLAISDAEAIYGTTRTLTLPGGRKVLVVVPVNVSAGHVIRLEEAASDGAPVLVTIAIKSPEQEYAPPGQSYKQDALTFRSTARTPVIADILKLIPVKALSRLSRRQIALSIGAVLLIVLASLGTFYFRSDNFLQRASLSNATLANPYGSVGMLALNDPLKDNSNGYFWPEGTIPAGTCTFASEAYHINTIIVGKHFCAIDTAFSNFAFEAQITILSGDAGGLIFRSEIDGANYYDFSIGQDGSYMLSLYADANNRQVLASSDPAAIPISAIHPGVGQSNLLAVVATGGTLTVYANHQQLATVNDSTLSQGHIGFVAEDDENATEVAFQNARVWTF